MIKGLGVSHAKTILLGEHSVVYGNPAIAFPIMGLTLKAKAEHAEGENWLSTPFHEGVVLPKAMAGETLEQRLAETALRNVLKWFAADDKNIQVNVSGLIPPARGLGSSAAVAVAIIRAVADLYGAELSDVEQFNLVQSVEKVAHGTPSGLDAHATSTRVPIWFENGQVKPLKLLTKPALLVADTGVPGHTAEAVSIVRKKRQENFQQVTKDFDKIAELTYEAGASLEDGDFENLGQLMTYNHRILQTLGVSNNKLDRLVDDSLRGGALGAKLTGGGLGGCIVVLGKNSESLPALKENLFAAGAKTVWDVFEPRSAEV